MSLIARTGLLLLGAAAFLLNPIACATGEHDEFKYGDAEMRMAVEGLWRVTVTPPSGTPNTFTVRLAQATGTTSASRGGPGLVRSAMACGNRTLVRSAAACVDVTTMPLTGMVIDGDERVRTSTVKGEMMVPGLIFTQAQLTMEIGTRKLFGQISSDGTVTGLGGDLLEGGSATMVRAE
jgi:hypothetical protein